LALCQKVIFCWISSLNLNILPSGYRILNSHRKMVMSRTPITHENIYGETLCKWATVVQGVSTNMSQLWMAVDLYTKNIITKQQVYYTVQYISICCTWAKNNRTTHLFFMSIWLYYKEMDSCHEWTLHEENWILILEHNLYFCCLN
jgi:hypothetical protein